MKLSWIFDSAATTLGIAGGVQLLVALVVGFARRKLQRAAVFRIADAAPAMPQR